MAPPAVLFINTELTQSIIDTFTRQLFITQVMDAATFDAIVASDGYYVCSIHQDGYRIMVLREANDETNRHLADLVLYAKTGLVDVQYNHTGYPSITLPIDRVYLTALFHLNRPPPWDPCHRRWTGQIFHFEGEIINTDFRPYVPYGTNPPYPGNKDFTGNKRHTENKENPKPFNPQPHCKKHFRY